MLTWGSAGQIVTVDDEPVGFALFAPPTAVPGAAAFPTSPGVAGRRAAHRRADLCRSTAGQGLARYLLNGVFAELSRRGVRAIELFGREADGPIARSGPSGRRRNRRAERRRAAGATDRRPTPVHLLPAGFARAVGFEDGRAASPLPAAAVRAGPGHRLEGRGRVGAGEAVHGDHRPGLAVPRRRSWSAALTGVAGCVRDRVGRIAGDSDTADVAGLRGLAVAGQAESRIAAARGRAGRRR